MNKTPPSCLHRQFILHSIYDNNWKNKLANKNFHAHKSVCNCLHQYSPDSRGYQVHGTSWGNAPRVICLYLPSVVMATWQQ